MEDQHGEKPGNEAEDRSPRRKSLRCSPSGWIGVRHRSK